MVVVVLWPCGLVVVNELRPGPVSLGLPCAGPPVGAIPSKGHALGQLLGNYPALAQCVNVVNEAAPGICAIVVLTFAAPAPVGPFGVRIPKSVSDFFYCFHLVGFYGGET